MRRIKKFFLKFLFSDFECSIIQTALDSHLTSLVYVEDELRKGDYVKLINLYLKLYGTLDCALSHLKFEYDVANSLYTDFRR